MKIQWIYKIWTCIEHPFGPVLRDALQCCNTNKGTVCLHKADT